MHRCKHCARQNSNIMNIIANFMPQIHSGTQRFICPSNPGELAMIGSYKLKHVVTLFALLGSTPTMAQMSEALDQGEALAVDAKIYASNYGVSQEEALRRLLIMLDTSSEIAGIEQEQDSRLAGVYFDNGPQFDLKVRVVGDVAPASRKIVRKAARLQFKSNKVARRAERKALRAKYQITDSEVEAAETAIQSDAVADVRFVPKGRMRKAERERQVVAKIAALKQRIPSLEMAFDDEQTEDTVIYVKTDDGSVKREAEALLGGPVRVVVIPTGLQQTAVRGGSILRRVSDDSWFCMTGFAAKRTSNGALGVLTAGHCINGTAMKYVDVDGTRINNIAAVSGMSQNNSTMDIAFLSEATAVAEFYADTTTTPRGLTATRSRTSTTAKAGTVKGSFVCHLGQTSPSASTLLQSCGEVTSTSGAGAQGGTTFVVVTNTQSGVGTTLTSGQGTLRCARGDSGGPVFAGTVAFGIQSACAWNDTAETITNILVYTSIDYALSIGASVVFK